MHNLLQIAESITGLSLKVWAWTMASVLGISLGVALDWAHRSIGLYVWEPQITFYVVVALILADALTGSMYAWRRDKFETRRAALGIAKLVSYAFLLAVAHNLAKSEPTLSWLPEATLGPMVIITLLSLLKNLHLLGWIDSALFKAIYRKVDKYKDPKDA